MTLRAWPSRSILVFSVETDFFGDDLTACENGHVLEHCFAALTEPGLTPTEVKVPRILLTTSVARASPSMSSAMMKVACRLALLFQERVQALVLKRFFR